MSSPPETESEAAYRQLPAATRILGHARYWPMAEMAARPEDFRIEPYRVDVRQAFRDRPNLGFDRP